MVGKFESAVILHSRKYKESSVLLTLWMPAYGKLNAIARMSLSKKNHACYQPFSLLSVDVKLPKSTGGLANIRALELEKSYVAGSYLSQLSRLYLNELLYWLLPQDHHDESLFGSYLLVIEGLVHDDVSRLLRHFELQLLESMGYAFQVEHDELNNHIQPAIYYAMAPLSAFYPTSVEYGVLGKFVLQFQQPVSSWDGQTLKVLQKFIRMNLDACLQGRALKTRELLASFLHNQNHS